MYPCLLRGSSPFTLHKMRTLNIYQVLMQRRAPSRARHAEGFALVNVVEADFAVFYPGDGLADLGGVWCVGLARGVGGMR